MKIWKEKKKTMKYKYSYNIYGEMIEKWENLLKEMSKILYDIGDKSMAELCVHDLMELKKVKENIGKFSEDLKRYCPKEVVDNG